MSQDVSRECRMSGCFYELCSGIGFNSKSNIAQTGAYLGAFSKTTIAIYKWMIFDDEIQEMCCFFFDTGIEVFP